jgi:hypothetical protein
MRRLAFLAGIGIGFVLGARAGRERYEQLRKLARRAADSPAARQAAVTVRAQAVRLARAAKDRMADRAGNARAKMGEVFHDRVPGLRHRDANGRSHGVSSTTRR